MTARVIGCGRRGLADGGVRGLLQRRSNRPSREVATRRRSWHCPAGAGVPPRLPSTRAADDDRRGRSRRWWPAGPASSSWCCDAGDTGSVPRQRCATLSTCPNPAADRSSPSSVAVSRGWPPHTGWSSSCPTAEVVVLEASPRIGGSLRTAEVGGVVIDVGAEAMLNRRPEGVDLARRDRARRRPGAPGDDLGQPVEPRPAGPDAAHADGRPARPARPRRRDLGEGAGPGGDGHGAAGDRARRPRRQRR